jgi:hypothetical protein
MEPLALAPIAVTGHHLAVADLVAVAVQVLVGHVLVVVVVLVVCGGGGSGSGGGGFVLRRLGGLVARVVADVGCLVLGLSTAAGGGGAAAAAGG